MRGAVLPPVPLLTAMAKAGNDVLVLPSLTRMVMLENVPTFELVGVPDNRPVVLLKLAHVGRFEMLNVSLSPLASLALGVKP